MAGITDPAFRTLSREFGPGLHVCEVITTRALVERRRPVPNPGTGPNP
jgi:tRNA-dihydrouridine synthase